MTPATVSEEVHWFLTFGRVRKSVRRVSTLGLSQALVEYVMLYLAEAVL
jgi:hypothetical protein